MEVYDISMDITYNMPVYRGKKAKRPVIKIDSDFVSGTVYESRLEMNLHTGTHLDSPLHMLEGGPNLDDFDLNRVVTRCKVLDFSNADEKITGDHLAEKDIETGDFILLKTKNSSQNILENDFIYLDSIGAEYLKSKQIKGVGIDALGIERNQPLHETHNILLGADIVIIEGLRLERIIEGEYLLVAAPLKILGVEAAPVRAILIK